jgi:uncharacterized protein YqeY
MSLNERINEDMKLAMKSQDKFKLTVIRTARSAIKNVEIDTRKELSDAEIIDILNREIKMRRDALQEFEAAGRQDLAEPLTQEIEILLAYVPKQLSEQELTEIIQAVIAEVGATSKADVGKVMPKLMPKVKGVADGRLVNQLVQNFLSE